MQQNRFRTIEAVDGGLVVSALGLLAGVLVTGYGFFHDLPRVSTAGVVMTGVISWVILLTMILRGEET